MTEESKRAAALNVSAAASLPMIDSTEAEESNL